MASKVDAVIICEDRLHRSIIEQWLKKRNIHSGKYRLYTARNNAGVLEELRKEFSTALKLSRQVIHIVVTDGDGKTAQQRIQTVEEFSPNVVQRQQIATDRLAWVIPCWAAETWVLHARGTTPLIETTSDLATHSPDVKQTDYKHKLKQAVGVVTSIENKLIAEQLHSHLPSHCDSLEAARISLRKLDWKQD